MPSETLAETAPKYFWQDIFYFYDKYITFQVYLKVDIQIHLQVPTVPLREGGFSALMKHFGFQGQSQNPVLFQDSEKINHSLHDEMKLWVGVQLCRLFCFS